MACQLSLMSRIELAQIPPGDDLPSMRNLIIRLTPEIDLALRKYSKDHHMMFGSVEGAAFAITFFLAAKGYYQPIHKPEP